MTSIEASLEDLVAGSSLVAVATPSESLSVWEDTDGPRAHRIVTYTKVEIERIIVGDHPTEPVWIRTLGGDVGNIGQRVEGEAVLVPGQTGLFFLRRRADGTHGLVGMSQGHFPIVSVVSDGTPRRMIRAGAVDVLLQPVGAAANAPGARALLAGRAIEEVFDVIQAAWGHRAK